MADILIQWLSDTHDCETCGQAWSEGATVYIDGERVLDMTPVAHCFDGDHYEPQEVFHAILAKLGHSVTEQT